LSKNCPEITQPTAWRYTKLYEKAKSNYSKMNNLTPAKRQLIAEMPVTESYRALGSVKDSKVISKTTIMSHLTPIQAYRELGIVKDPTAPRNILPGQYWTKNIVGK